MPKTKAFSNTKGGAGADDFKKKRVKLGKRVAKPTATDTKCVRRSNTSLCFPFPHRHNANEKGHLMIAYGRVQLIPFEIPNADSTC